MRNLATIIVLAHCLSLVPAFAPRAQQGAPIEAEEVVKRANYLEGILDNLLTSPNFSSIRKVTENGDAQVKGLVDKAMALRAKGATALAEERYLDAVSNFQASIEHIFEAIKTAKLPATKTEQKMSVRLAKKFEINQTFISAATRVVEEEAEPNEDAMQLLQMAKDGRRRAEAKSKQGSEDEALVELDKSTSLAKRAIIAVRDGKMIEREGGSSSAPR